MIKRFLYFKKNNIIERGEIKNLYLFNKDFIRIPFGAITPIIENKFIYDNTFEYLTHPANVPISFAKKDFRIKIGFLSSKDKKELMFGVNTSKYMVVNPIVMMRSPFLEIKDKVSVFINGKRKLSKHLIGKTFNNIDILDFYPIIDTIFYNLKQFDAVLEKTGIIVSFKTDGG